MECCLSCEWASVAWRLNQSAVGPEDRTFQAGTAPVILVRLVRNSSDVLNRPQSSRPCVVFVMFLWQAHYEDALDHSATPRCCLATSAEHQKASAGHAEWWLSNANGNPRSPPKGTNRAIQFIVEWYVNMRKKAVHCQYIQLYEKSTILENNCNPCSKTGNLKQVILTTFHC